MKYRLAEDAKPQLKLLLLATIITIALWFIPYLGIVTYPIRLFVTFIHEGSHVLAALLTGGSVHSLTIASDGSGVVYSVPSGLLGALATSSAGYLGSTFFGVLLLFLIRKAISAKKVLFGSAVFIAVMTILFSIITPLLNVFSLQVSFLNIAFTVLAGTILTAGLFAIGKYGSERTANFAVAFLAIQCLLNAVFDLATLFLINAPFSGMDLQNDATNMANATGLPSFAWVLIWIGLSILMISVGLRFYAVSQKSKQHDLPFED
jgi:hypothetical protein